MFAEAEETYHDARLYMVSPLQLEDSAPWRQRFRVKALGSAYVAPENPAWGFVTASWDGPQLQIYAREIPSGDLRPMTRQDDRISYG